MVLSPQLLSKAMEEEMATSQFSSLENPTVRDWQAIVHRVTMSETIWARTHTYTHTLGYMLHRWLLLSLYREISILSVTLLTFKEFLYLGSIDLVIFHSSNWRVLFYVCVCVCVLSIVSVCYSKEKCLVTKKFMAHAFWYLFKTCAMNWLHSLAFSGTVWASSFIIDKYFKTRGIYSEGPKGSMCLLQKWHVIKNSRMKFQRKKGYCT